MDYLLESKDTIVEMIFVYKKKSDIINLYNNIADFMDNLDDVIDEYSDTMEEISLDSMENAIRNLTELKKKIFGI